MTSEFNSRPIFKYLSWGILLSGLVLRIVVFFQNRSLFIDEGALAAQIVAKNFGAFFEPLNYQFSPPLFSCLVKCSTLLFGANEYALRLVPLLAGIGSLLIFYKLIVNLFPAKIYLFSLAVFSFALPFIHYSTECKQYSVDVLVSTILLSLFYKSSKTILNSSQLIFCSALGAIVIWCSMPVVFTLFGLGIYWMLKAWQKKDVKQVIQLIIMCGSWLISFGVYFFMILKKDADIGSLASYHTAYFFPLIPRNLSELSQAWFLLMSFLKAMLRGTVLAQLLGLGLFISGIIHLWRKNKYLLVPILLPILSCVFASGVGFYSLIPRMILFSMPMILLLFAYGIEYLLFKLSKLWVITLAIAMLLVFFNLDSFKYIYQPFEVDEIRPVLEYVHDHQQSDQSVFVHYLGSTAFRFYQFHHEDKSSYELQRVFENKWSDNIAEVAAAQKLPCWLILTHVNPVEQEKVLAEFTKHGNIADEFNRKNSSAILIIKN